MNNNTHQNYTTTQWEVETLRDKGLKRRKKNYFMIIQKKTKRKNNQSFNHYKTNFV